MVNKDEYMVRNEFAYGADCLLSVTLLSSSSAAASAALKNVALQFVTAR